MSRPAREPSVVLTHHWLLRRRGGEKVVEVLGELFPEAPLYTLVRDPAYADRFHPASIAGGPVWLRDAGHIHTSWLQRIPGAWRRHQMLLPFMASAARGLRLPDVDLVLCSDAALAKAMTPHPRSKVICYCHSPMRYAWDLEHAYLDSIPAVLRPLWPALVRRLRAADQRAAERVDVFVANSRYVAERINRCYARESRVVHPPVDIPADLTPRAPARPPYYLCVGYHVPYKRLDLAVEACRHLRRPLVVIGEGPDCSRLRDNGAEVRFLGWQPDHVIERHYQQAAALLFPGEEDFGIVPVEAMARGCPVVAFGVGGATETVLDGVTGAHFPEQTVDCICDAMRRVESTVFDPLSMFLHAQRFAKSAFVEQMRGIIDETLAGRRGADTAALAPIQEESGSG